MPAPHTEMATSRHGMFRITRDGPVTLIELDRPEALNALRMQDKQDFVDLLHEETALQTRAIILTGREQKAFCAGTDIKQMAGFSAEEMLHMLEVEGQMYDAVLAAPMPVIAAVNGYALGAGCILASCCDLVIAAEHATFGQPEVRNGVPAPLHVALLPRIVGLNRARWMLYTCVPIDAGRAREFGLVGEVVPDDQLTARALELAREIAMLPAQSMALQKRIIDSWIRDSFDHALEKSVQIAGSAFDSDEPSRSITDFLRRKRS